MRQYIVFPIVFGLGLLFAGFMPSRVGTLGADMWEPSSQILSTTEINHFGHQPAPASMLDSLNSVSSGSLKPTVTPTLQNDSQELGRPTQLRVDGDFLKRESRKPFMSLPKEANCDPRAHILVINSHGQTGQQGRDHINREFTKAGLAGLFHFWPAESASSNGEAAEIERGHELQALSHRRIYETLLYMKWACATIFEDNVRLVDDFLPRLTSITDSIPPFDVIFWGGSVEKVGKKPELTYGQPGGQGPCWFAYTVSLQGALLLLQATPATLAKGNDTSYQNLRKIRPHINKSPHLMAGSYWTVVPTMAFKGWFHPAGGTAGGSWLFFSEKSRDGVVHGVPPARPQTETDRDPRADLRLLSASLHDHDADSFALRSLSLLIKLKRCEIAKGHLKQAEWEEIWEPECTIEIEDGFHLPQSILSRVYQPCHGPPWPGRLKNDRSFLW